MSDKTAVREWQLTKKFRFEAAHLLTGHDGKCARLHGHSWRGKLVFAGSKLERGTPKDGMLLDFGDIKHQFIKPLEDLLDHSYLNEALVEPAPTSEVIAFVVFQRTKDSLKEQQASGHFLGVRLLRVEISETCTSSASYSERSDDVP